MERIHSLENGHVGYKKSNYLIDMRHMPDDSYNYIAYYMDRWPKFHVMWSLMRKSAVEVGVGLAQNHSLHM
ncbi:hypothetical protein EMCRGX_G033436 [Ephydatia muelleri]